jgi:hypothetical protein
MIEYKEILHISLCLLSTIVSTLLPCVRAMVLALPEQDGQAFILTKYGAIPFFPFRVPQTKSSSNHSREARFAHFPFC